MHSVVGWIIESGGHVYGNNNRLRTERTLSRNCPCSIGRKAATFCSDSVITYVFSLLSTIYS